MIKSELSEKIKKLRDEHIYVFPAIFDGPLERSPIVWFIFPDECRESRFPLIPHTLDKEDELIDLLREKYKETLEEITK